MLVSSNDKGSTLAKSKGYLGMQRKNVSAEDIFFCHPYCSWERGTNVNINKMIRHFIPKRVDMDAYSEKEIERIQHWITNYPRRVLRGCSANMAKARENVA